MKQLKQYNNSFKRQYIKIAADIRNIGLTPEIELRMRELGIVDTETSKAVDFRYGLTSGTGEFFRLQVKMQLCDGCVIIVTQDEIEQFEMSDKKRAVIESNIYARMLNEMIAEAKKCNDNETVKTFEDRFNRAIQQEKGDTQC